ncbi:MAG TPA: ABC transporter substrate-binding protein, partial [Tepidisphaeraceae bacterium]|nr:ABC transporter substrate-binding protein [Tepidisphaeraceae bacterium]
ELADLWNSIEPQVHLKMSVLSHAGYDSKLRVAIASGQPPDVAFGGLQTLESLQYSGKASDLAAPIPPQFFSKERLASMGPIVQRSVLHNGKPTIFPIWRYAYGGFILANNEMLKQAGYDDEQIRKNGWTIAQFRDACKKMTRDTNGDGKPDTWGFGAALAHLQHLLLDEFGPGIWGKEIAKNNLLAYDPNAKRWTLHPGLSENHIEQAFTLFDQLINVDKSWNPAYLGMPFGEIIDDITIHRRLGMTFGETPWVPRLRREIWEANQALGAHQPEPPELSCIWMPTAKAGDRPAPRAGVMGFSVLKQIPYKGDAHTEHAMRVALFLTHPVHLARSQVRSFRHLPPNTKEFAEIYPELVHADDKWVKFYNEVMDSNIPIAPEEANVAEAQHAAMAAKVDQWMTKQGVEYLQQVIYQKLTPHEGAVRFFRDLKALTAKDD